MTQPVLVFGYGNPGRGDDALGPDVVAAIEAAIETSAVSGKECPLVETQTDMQLQVEHVTDLEGRECILFVDADVSCAEPYVFSTMQPEKDGSYTSHAMTPGALLHAYRQVYGSDAPPAYMLRIRGYNFELGDPMCKQAEANLAAAVQLVRKLCTAASPELWDTLLSEADTGMDCGIQRACGGYMLPTTIEQSIPE